MTKILLFDIETAPSKGFVWGKWEQNVIDFEQYGYMLSFAYKWLGEKTVHVKGLPDYKHYKKRQDDDLFLVQDLYHLFEEADIVVAHNGDRFDIPFANQRFILHGFKPPAPFKTVDTLRIARGKMNLPSNKLDDIGAYFGIGRKLSHTGAKLWFDCMAGDTKAWALMKKYNAQDVVLLEQVYLKLRAWLPTHPNVNLVDMEDKACPTCASKKLQMRGFMYTRTSKFVRFHCQNCGAWSRGLSAGKLDIK